MLEQMEQLRMSLDSAKYSYDGKREPYKTWLEWRIECIGHVDRMDMVCFGVWCACMCACVRVRTCVCVCVRVCLYIYKCMCV